MPPPPRIMNLVYAALEQTAVLTSQQIAERYGLRVRAVSNAIQQAKTSDRPRIYSRRIRTGIQGYNSVREYSLKPFPSEASRTAKIAPRYVPPFEEMTPEKYDLWQGRNLAMLVRPQ